MIAFPILAASFHQIYEFFRGGGFFMIPLLACSVIAVTVGIVCGLGMRRHLVVPEELEKEIERIAPNDTPDAVVRLPDPDHASTLGLDQRPFHAQR